MMRKKDNTNEPGGFFQWRVKNGNYMVITLMVKSHG